MAAKTPRLPSGFYLGQPGAICSQFQLLSLHTPGFPGSIWGASVKGQDPFKGPLKGGYRALGTYYLLSNSTSQRDFGSLSRVVLAILGW